MTDRQTGIKLKLVGEDGNAFAILGRAKRALMNGGKAYAVDQFIKDATSGDYNHLLCVCAQYFKVV